MESGGTPVGCWLDCSALVPTGPRGWIGVGLKSGGVPIRGGGVNGCRRLPTGARMGTELGIGVPGALEANEVGKSIDTDSFCD